MGRYVTDGGTSIDPRDREAVRRHLERFAGTDAVSVANDGTISAECGEGTHVAVRPDGSVDIGMPMHSFVGAPGQLVFDHEAGELRVELGDNVSYTFRRP